MAGGRGASPFFLHSLYSREQLGSLKSCLRHINTNKTPPRLPLSKCQHLLAPEPSANFPAASLRSPGLAGGDEGGGAVWWPALPPALGSVLGDQSWGTPGGSVLRVGLRASRVSGTTPQQRLGIPVLEKGLLLLLLT